MSVKSLDRNAQLVFRHLYAPGEDLLVGERRCLDLQPDLGEEGLPERKVFVIEQRSGNAYAHFSILFWIKGLGRQPPLEEESNTGPGGCRRGRDRFWWETFPFSLTSNRDPEKNIRKV